MCFVYRKIVYSRSAAVSMNYYYSTFCVVVRNFIAISLVSHYSKNSSVHTAHNCRRRHYGARATLFHFIALFSHNLLAITCFDPLKRTPPNGAAGERLWKS